MIKLILICLTFFSLSIFSSDFHLSRKWLNALYYESKSSGYESLADNDSFFISKDGKYNPKNEYMESLALVKAQNLEFKKMFPYRYKIIAEENKIPYLPVVFVNQDIKKIVVVYPNKYMSNPASMFGHLFIVVETNNGLLDSHIVHFLANTSNTPQSAYFYNGLTGKFKGSFLVEPYYKKIKDYNYIEDRHVTYYDLDFDSIYHEDIQLHAYELQNAFFYYYFIDENCAYFMVKFLNNFFDEDIINRSLIIYPSQIINALNEKKLLKNDYKRLPSVKLFTKSYSRLNREQKDEVFDLITKKSIKLTNDVDVMKTFILISEYVINNQPNFAQIIRYNRIQVFKKLNELKDQQYRPSFQYKNQPKRIFSKGINLNFLGSYSNFSSLNAFNTNGLSFFYRPIYFGKSETMWDLENKEISVLSFGVDYFNQNKIRFQFVPFDINNTSIYNRILNDFSTKMKTNFSFQDSLNMDHSFEMGVAYQFFEQNLVNVFVGGNFSDYDSLLNSQLDFLMLAPSFAVGFKQLIQPGHVVWDLSYQAKYRNQYLVSRLDIRAFDMLFEKKLIFSNDDQILSFGSTILF